MRLLGALALRLVLTVLGSAVVLLPRRAELAFGRFLGRVVLASRLFKVQTAESNIELCFPQLDAEARRRLLQRNFEHYGILFFEYLHFFSPVPGHFARYAARISRLENKHLWEKAKSRGAGVLFFSAHLGFWEMSAARAGLESICPTVVTKVVKPPWVHERLSGCRESVGVSHAYHPGSMPAILRALRKGGAVAFMNDQYARPPMGLPVVFFNRRVETLSVVGALARRTGAPVLPVSVRRDANGINVTTIEPELDLSSAGDDAEKQTQLIASHVEGWVRRDPEQWLWMHRRFKNSLPA